MMPLRIELHHLIKIVMSDAAADRHAETVGDEIEGMPIVEERGIFRKNTALLRFFDIRLELHHPVLAGVNEEIVQHLQCRSEERLVEPAWLEDAGDAFDQFLDHGQRIRDERGPHAGAYNDQYLGGLKQHHDIAALHEVSAHDGYDDDAGADDCKHCEFVTGRSLSISLIGR